MNILYVFNPLTGNLDPLIVPPSRAEVIKSILLATQENELIPQILFDEDSILYEDDGFTEC